MVPTTFLLLLVRGLLQCAQQAGEGMDEAERERVRQRAEYPSQQMTRLVQELEHESLEQSHGAWGALLVWQPWAVLGIPVLFLVLWFGLKTIRGNLDSSGQKESSSSNLVEEEECDNVVARKEIESNNINVKEDNKDGNEEDEDRNAKINLKSYLDELIRSPVENLDKGYSMIIDLMGKLTQIFGQGLSDSFYPVPQEVIGVGSTFECWSPCAHDVVYRVLVPLRPPPGHTFHLELDTVGMPQRSFCVRVELQCTCMREQPGEDMLCFLHHPEKELRRKQEPSLLHTLCTGSYLDVEKTVQWFCRFVRVAWLLLPQSHHWRLMLQPSSRSCKFQLSKDKESFMAEMIFGVRQGDSDIFVGSQPSQVGIPSTTWLETYAMAEAKFFRHISRQAPQESWYCKCLQLLSGSLRGVGFSSYTLKTAVMHFLSTMPLTRWRRRDLGQRLMDILKYLHCSLKAKRLDHFVIGNERLLVEIRLPSDLQLAEPVNLFQHLASNLYALVQAMQEYIDLLHQLKQLLIHSS